MSEPELSAFLDGELPPEAAAALALRVAQDRALAARLHTLARLRATLRGLDAGAVPPALPAASPARLPAVAAIAALLAGAAIWAAAPGRLTPPGEASPEAAAPALEPPPVQAHRRFLAATLPAGAAEGPLGLSLAWSEPVAGGLYAGYLGPRGCRLGVWTGPPAALPAAAPDGWHEARLIGESHATWLVAEPVMDPFRFAALVEAFAAERSGELRVALGPREGGSCRG